VIALPDPSGDQGSLYVCSLTGIKIYARNALFSTRAAPAMRADPPDLDAQSATTVSWNADH
jgi:hypothetical protein